MNVNFGIGEQLINTIAMGVEENVFMGRADIRPVVNLGNSLHLLVCASLVLPHIHQ